MDEHLSNSPEDRKATELKSVVLTDSIKLPPGLASRTCAKIWATIDNAPIDNKEQDYAPNSGTFLDSAYFSPETVLPASYLLGTSEPEEIRYELPKVRKRVEIVEEPPRRSAPGNGLIVPIVIGVVVSVLLFPMVAYITRSTKSYVAGSWESEINRRVGNFEQIHAGQGNTAQSEELLPYNLAASSWQELRAEMFAHSPRPNQLMANQRMEGVILGTNRPPTPFEAAVGTAVGSPYTLPLPYPREAVAISAHFPDGTVIPQFPPSASFLEDLNDFSDWEMLVSADITGMADIMLLATPGQETSVRLAFGQNILLKDGRVFFSVLPGVDAAAEIFPPSE